MNSALSLSGPARIQAFLNQNRVWLAPMAGVNDACFRSICKRMGAGITYTEMISALGLHYHSESESAKRLLTISEDETPVAVQLFGSDEAVIAEQASAIAKSLGNDLAFIDINMGCPVPKVVRKGEGSALMLSPALASGIVSRTAEALEGKGEGGSDIPVTVKFRKGTSMGDERAVSFAYVMQEAGASAVAVHGRYQEQFFSGTSDHEIVTQVAQALDIPVIGSGDVMSAQDAVNMITPVSNGGVGAAGVMIARGAQGNPWIFKQVKALMRGEEPHDPSYHEIFTIMREHAICIERIFGRKALVRMRKHAIWYCAGLPGASYFRAQINSLTSMRDLEQLIEAYQGYLNSLGSVS
ncbi:MAG: tRNA dihydrouridine synthase DusB [Actinomycetia bacterium]|nr:tRNA dihydrouridine synthase DusB [Actinomycetes bacterium]